MNDERIALEKRYRRESVLSRENALIALHQFTGFESDAVDFDLGQEARIKVHVKTLRDAIDPLSENVKLTKLRSYRTYANRLLLYADLVRQIAVEFDMACEKVIREDVYGNKGRRIW